MTTTSSTSQPHRAAAASVPGRPCSIALALQVVGERWALLAVREINFGNHRFDQIVRNTGAPRDILTARLRALEQAGVIHRRQYQEHPPRFEYQLTQAGIELRPVLNGLRRWGDRWLAEEPPVLVEHVCGHPLEIVSHCAHCGKLLDPAGDAGDWSEQFVAPGWDRKGRSAPEPLRRSCGRLRTTEQGALPGGRVEVWGPETSSA